MFHNSNSFNESRSWFSNINANNNSNRSIALSLRTIYKTLYFPLCCNVKKKVSLLFFKILVSKYKRSIVLRFKCNDTTYIAHKQNENKVLAILLLLFSSTYKIFMRSNVDAYLYSTLYFVFIVQSVPNLTDFDFVQCALICVGSVSETGFFIFQCWRRV